jgi:hypothetical protein
MIVNYKAVNLKQIKTRKSLSNQIIFIMKIGGYDMAKKTHHHLYQRKGIWYFRKGSTRITLETTVATEAKKIRDRMLENYKLTGQFYDSIEDSTLKLLAAVAKEWAVFSKIESGILLGVIIVAQ